MTTTSIEGTAVENVTVLALDVSVFRDLVMSAAVAAGKDDILPTLTGIRVEWAEKIHRSTPQASRLLRNAIRDGAAEMRVYKVQVGRWKRPVPHYRLIQPVRSKRGCSGTAS